jgi:hypothetical protein
MFQHSSSSLNFKRLLNTPIGISFISILLGLGLATLFRKVCNDKNCIVFNGPLIDTITGKTYRYGEKCYQYETVPAKCNKHKKIVELVDPEDMKNHRVEDPSSLF